MLEYIYIYIYMFIEMSITFIKFSIKYNIIHTCSLTDASAMGEHLIYCSNNVVLSETDMFLITIILLHQNDILFRKRNQGCFYSAILPDCACTSRALIVTSWTFTQDR
jgi:hypothetical protein